MFIAIEGGIGAGKTTTAQLCAERLQYELVLEKTEGHPFLNDFYAEPGRFAVETELAFVLIHYHQLHAILSARYVVSDFSPAKDLVYAHMNLAGADLALFVNVYNALTARVKRPDLVIYLHLPINELMRRIKERGRAYEMYVSQSYIELLALTYENHMSSLGDEVCVLDVSINESREEIADRVISLVQSRLPSS